MLNIIYNISQDIKKGLHEDGYVLYVTLENLALETNQRMLCKHLDLTLPDIESIIRTRDCNNVIRTALNDFKESNIVVAYFPSRTYSVTDLYSYVENLNLARGQKPVCIVVDYLDIMKLPAYHSELRHQLGDITLGLKNLAVMYKIPVLSATQLLKGAYEGKPTLGAIKESSEKIDHADAIGLIHRLDSGDDLESHIEQYGFNVEISFDKSRASANGTLRFAMFLNKFKILEEQATMLGGCHPSDYTNSQANIPPRVSNTPQAPLPPSKPTFQSASNDAFDMQSQGLTQQDIDEGIGIEDISI